jgi:hypothetical protein
VSEQGDLDVAEYGTAATSIEFVSREVESFPDARVRFFLQGYWYGSQDVYVVGFRRPT